MKSDMTKCEKCRYSSWLGKDMQYICLRDIYLSDDDRECEFKEKETRFFEIEFNGEKLFVRQFTHYSIYYGEVVNLTIFRNKEMTEINNQLFEATHCHCFLNEAEVLGLLKATMKTRIIE